VFKGLKKFYVLSEQSMCFVWFCMVLRISCDYIPIRH